MTGRRGRGLAGLGSAVLPAAVSAAAARAAYALLSSRPPGGQDTWTRTNHRGEQVTLAEGPAAAAAAVMTAAITPGLGVRPRAALAAAGLGAAAFGCYDDLAGSGDRRGFRGHLAALARGEVTSGAVKIAGIGAAGLACAALLGGPPADVVINAGLAAGGANLLNLFDLRPGRAIKVPGAPWRHRRQPRSRCSLRIWRSGPCSATRARMRSAGCSARRPRPACPAPRGSPCWPGSPA